ncbi:Zona pellucida sperm-binding protein 4 [Dissostichus eleginoides]|uniref:Zona pellucida sperm-binding protein 4 n=1 Tax=Dissostichus eleginoides TaxID=100907 RepID=A0AAD9ETJ6_DISEL|nr:Zona pellucida sperm-binding protein 4 [Dissostichus eleginoides]
MNYHCEKLCWITLFFAMMTQHCWCSSAIRLKETSEELHVPRVTCSDRRIRAMFGPLVRSNVHVKDRTGVAIPVPESEGSCGVRLGRERNQSLAFYSRYDSCYAQIEGSRAIVPLNVQLTGEDGWFNVTISCPLIKRHSQRTKRIPESFPGDCATERVLRVDCACSVDGHFVFSVTASDTEKTFDPSSLIVKDQPQCFPVITTPDTAVFKIRLTECGAKLRVDADVTIYEVEVEELHTKSIINYSPFRLQVQCEYDASDLKRAAGLRSLFPVTNPPTVVGLGTIGVQMRIAQDASFTSFFPEEKLPVSFSLRKILYVEISIAQPSLDPTLSLRVRDCFAYPASRHSVWTLLYDGCPNPLDKMRSVIPENNQKTTTHSQVRRFDVEMFAFSDPHTGSPSGEDMYFFCWVEICTDDVDCAQKCAIVSSEGKRQRRDAESDQVQLVSLGPLLLGQNSTEPEESPCARQKKMFQATMYILCGVGAALIFILTFTAWSGIRKRQKPDAKRVQEQVDGEQCQ